MQESTEEFGVALSLSCSQAPRQTASVFHAVRKHAMNQHMSVCPVRLDVLAIVCFFSVSVLKGSPMRNTRKPKYVKPTFCPLDTEYKGYIGLPVWYDTEMWMIGDIRFDYPCDEPIVVLFDGVNDPIKVPFSKMGHATPDFKFEMESQFRMWEQKISRPFKLSTRVKRQVERILDAGDDAGKCPDASMYFKGAVDICLVWKSIADYYAKTYAK